MIALGSDHVGLELKKIIIEMLEQKNISYRDYGTYGTATAEYPRYGYKAARAVANGECEKGLLFCGTGVGISIAANKVRGIRCAVCSEPYSALLSRKHNDTNMLSMGSRVVGAELAKMIATMWLESEFEGGRHADRIALFTEIEETNAIKGE